jgi:acetylornithine deacetylase/succinyl-diaminopimelate desuccinylase-like protein
MHGLRLLAALSGLLAAVIAGATAPDPHDAPASVQPLARDLLKELIETNTTHSHGTSVAAEHLATRFRAAGFAPEDVSFLAPAEHPEQGNVVVRLRGRGHGRPVLYLCHLDVVEARRADWTYDPFVLTEQGGWLYGRGTIDMKGQDAAVAASLMTLRQQGFVPERDIIVAFTADEEAGGVANGVDWLLRNHRDLIDSELVINPDGGEAGMLQGRRLYVAVQTSEKVFLSLGLTVTDKGGHSSVPTAANPIFRLSAALERLSRFRFPVHLTDTTRMYFDRRAGLESGQRQADMRALAAGTADTAAVERLSADVETNIMFRTTCTATLIEGGHAENALPQAARATLQCRVIPGETPESVIAAVRGAITDPTVEISTVTAARPSPESPPLPQLIKTVEGITHSLWPDVIVVPEMSPGASDSAYSRTAGLPSYGIDAMFDDLADGRAHGRDERIGIDAFRDEVVFTYRLMRRLGTPLAR